MADFKFNFDLEDSDTEAKDDISKETSSAPVTKADSPGLGIPGTRCLAKRIGVQPRHQAIADHASPVSVCYSVPGTDHKLRYVTADIIQSMLQSVSQTSDLRLSPACGNGSESRLPSRATSDSEPSTHQVTEATFTHLLELSNSKHTDLIPGLYEGGMKTWECAYDLVDYLSEIDFDFTGMKVLELGCGTGLPSIYALMKGAGSVSLQDYNPEVVDCITIPSVLLNLHSIPAQGVCKQIPQTHSSIIPAMKNSEPFFKNLISECVSKCSFYCGDWNDIINLLTSDESRSRDIPCKFDVILTSETIYSESSQPKLLSAIKSLIEPSKGRIFVAAKSYYFGVGGTCYSFEQLVESDGYFSLERCKTINASVPRVIMCLRHSAS